MAKEGNTKSGKSLKALRRYYALKNSQKEQKEAKTAEDDKLSRRIANELKAQQEAIQKRLGSPAGKDASGNPGQIPLPEGVVMSPKQSGPVFVTETPEPPPQKNLDPLLFKSSRSFASFTKPRGFQDNERLFNLNRLDNLAFGGVITLSIIFSTSGAWESLRRKPKQTESYEDDVFSEIHYEVTWIGITSVLALISAIYCMCKRHVFFHAVVSVSILIICALSTVILMATHRSTKYSSGLVQYSVFENNLPILSMSILVYLIVLSFCIFMQMLYVFGVSTLDRIARNGPLVSSPL